SIACPPRLAPPPPPATVAPEPAAAAESAFRLRPRLVHGQPAPAQLIPVEFARRFLRLFVGAHRTEGKAAGPPGGGVAHHPHRLHLPDPTEQLLQLRLARRIREVPDVQPSTHRFSPDQLAVLRSQRLTVRR